MRELVQAGILAALGPNVAWQSPTFSAQTHGGSYRFGFTVPGLSSVYPERVLVPWGRRGRSPDPRFDADLYLRDLPLADMHPGVTAALREAVECFRRDLFLPCMAMLAAAADGLWVEAGRALVSSAVRRDKAVEKAEGVIDNERSGLAQRVQAVTELYARRDLFEAIHHAVGRRDLREAEQWTDVLRDARNVLHWGFEPATENSYAKVATLFECAPLHVRALSSVCRAAGRQPTPSPRL